MKKYLYASLLAACLTTPSFAAAKLSNKSPDDPVHRRAIVLCMVAFVALHAYQRRLTRQEQAALAYRR